MSTNVGVKKIVKSFLQGEPRRIKNDIVKEYGPYHGWTYHGSAIAWYEHVNDVEVIRISLQGYGTPTTRLRLNALLDALNIKGGFYQSKHVQYLGEHEIDATDVFTIYPGVQSVDEMLALSVFTEEARRAA